MTRAGPHRAPPPKWQDGTARADAARCLDRYLADHEQDLWADLVEDIARLGNSALIDLQGAARRVAERFGAGAALHLAQSCLHIGELSDDDVVRHLLRRAEISVISSRSPEAFHELLDMLVTVARQMPHVLPALLESQSQILSRLDTGGLRHWIGAGLALATWDRDGSLGYFRLETDQARALLAQMVGDYQFADGRIGLGAYLRALFGAHAVIATFPADQLPRNAVRSSFFGPLIRLPASYPGVTEDEGFRHFRAVLAHIAAHVRFGATRQPVGRLKPVQVALISLIEDARVETLASREFPGLARLWAGFHTAEPSGAVTPDKLMARLARSLADSGYADGNPWVEKGRRLFLEGRSRWSDPLLSREIGGLLGNDLGQMRLAFNARTYVVQPGYRDDNAGLWDMSPDADEVPTTAEALVDGPLDMDDGETAAAEAAPNVAVAQSPGSQGERLLGHFPEWDCKGNTLRSAWTTVFSHEPVPAPPAAVRELEESAERTVGRLAGLIRKTHVGRSRRRRGLTQGDSLDIDACIGRMVDMRAGIAPEPRVYQTRQKTDRELSVLVLMDISRSTRQGIEGTTRSILAVERQAVAALGMAMAQVGDPFAILGFCSDGRGDVRVHEVKDFAQPFDRTRLARLAGLRGDLSTRLGAALRLAGARISVERNIRKLVLVVSDGEPSDIDVSDPDYLIEDARHAVQELNQAGTDVFAVGLGQEARNHMRRVFGANGFRMIDRVGELPQHLTQLYHRLST